MMIYSNISSEIMYLFHISILDKNNSAPYDAHYLEVTFF